MTNQKKTHDEHLKGDENNPEIEIDRTTDETHEKTHEKAHEKSRGKAHDHAHPDEQPVTPEAKASNREAEESQDAKYLRLMADFQNYKRRSEKERTEIHAYANEKIVLQLLEVLDNFERALQQENGTEEQFRNGMLLILEQLKTVLNKTGVSEIPADGAEFDPNYHHAIMMENKDSIKSGHVSMVLQKGYTMNGKVIRPAIVKVAE
jgi:molecular chaperone GrpE